MAREGKTRHRSTNPCILQLKQNTQKKTPEQQIISCENPDIESLSLSWCGCLSVDKMMFRPMQIMQISTCNNTNTHTHTHTHIHSYIHKEKKTCCSNSAAEQNKAVWAVCLLWRECSLSVCLCYPSSLKYENSRCFSFTYLTDCLTEASELPGKRRYMFSFAVHRNTRE